jgi:error-prone DNA polymerase
VAYTELLARSSFSFLMGASSPEELVERTKEFGQTSLAICDRDGLYGCVRAHKKAKELGLRLHVGAEVGIAPLGRSVARSETPRAIRQSLEPNDPTLALLVRNHDGYRSLCQLLTQAHAGLPKGQSWVESSMLEQHSDGLIVVVPVQLGVGGRTVRRWLRFLKQCFHARGYIAVFRRFDGADVARIGTARSWSRESGFPILASARPSFHAAHRKPLADILQCIRTGVTLDEAGTALQANAETVLRSEGELYASGYDPRWIQRTEEVAKELEFSLDQLRYEFPCALAPGETADERLARLAWEGAERRYPQGTPEKVAGQMRKELRLIAELHVASYFLCTYEIVEIARSLRILCQGRGSAANSAVCYVLGITAVDPARSNLLFERFLSAERNEPPDIDVDFEHERREEVIQEIYRRYGRNHAAMVSEVISYRGKSALREVGKVFGLSLAQVDQLSQMITHWDSADVPATRLEEYGFDPRDGRLTQTLQWARVLQGFPRHLSIHVGGFVLSKKELCEVAPVEPAAMPGRTVVPWDKDDIDELGFFKVDVLGLGMLTAIRKTLALCFEDGALRRDGDVAFDPLDVVTRVPSEDRAVYATISEADTVGVFQIESRAQMAMLPRLRPQTFYDLVIEVAIVRPGPIQGGMVHPYLRRRNKEETPSVPHPDLDVILERTLGVPLFQEQVMQIAIVGAGYTGGQADQLRRDMAAWKKSGRLLRHRKRLLSGFEKKGISKEFGQALFEQIKGFGEYGFPESHAASFALLVYTSAWQKTHFPAHFVCALLNSQPMGFYSPASLVRDAKEHGVEARPVTIVDSEWDSTLERPSSSSGIRSQYPEAQRALRLGLRLVRGLGEATGRRIERVRREAPFKSLEDAIRRAQLAKNEVEALAEAGAFEPLEHERRQALWKARAPRGFGLLEGVNLTPEDAKVKLPELPKVEQLVMDYERVGFSLTDHPMCHLREQLDGRGVVRASGLQHWPHKKRLEVAGVVLARQRPGTASGVVFVTLEDETGVMNLVLFSQVFDKYRLVARHASLLLARGTLERQLTKPEPGQAGRPTPVIHVIVEHLERLDVDGPKTRVPSRDFH